MKYLKSIWFVIALSGLVNYAKMSWELGTINLGDYNWTTFIFFIISILLTSIWTVWFINAAKSFVEELS